MATMDMTRGARTMFYGEPAKIRRINKNYRLKLKQIMLILTVKRA